MLNFSNILESVADAPNRFFSLKELYPVLEEGQPKLRAGRDYCDIEMSDGRARYTLRCFTRKDKATAGQLSELSSFLSAIDEPVYGRFSFLENELLVFEDNGGYVYADVVLWEEPDGKTLSDFAENCLSGKMPGGEVSLKALMEQLAAFSGRHLIHKVDVGGVSHRNFTVSPAGRLRLVGLEAARRGDCSGDITGMAVIFTILYLAFSDRRVLGFLHDTALSGQYTELLRRCADSGELPGPLGELFAILAGVPARDAISPGKAERLLFLMQQTAGQGVTRVVDLSELIPDTVGQERSTIAVPAVKYEFVGESSCMMMRAYDGEKWCYLDHNGRVAIPGPFIEASDFWEGLAVVEVDYGRNGVIDRLGNFVIPPVYEDMEYDQTGNRYIASSNGLSALLSRTGEKITEFIYDNILTEREGFYIVQKNGKFGYITRNGEAVTEIIYEDASAFRNGTGRVTLKGREYLIGPDGAIIEEIVRE